MAQQIQNQLRYLALFAGFLGILWLGLINYGQPDSILIPSAVQHTELRAGTVSTMDSPPFD